MASLALAALLRAATSSFKEVNLKAAPLQAVSPAGMERWVAKVWASAAEDTAGQDPILEGRSLRAQCLALQFPPAWPACWQVPRCMESLQW